MANTALMRETTSDILRKQRNFFATGTTKPYEFRVSQLRLLRKTILANTPAISEALHKDLNKHEFESYAAEIGIILDEISAHVRKLKRWVKPTRVATSMVHFPSHSWIVPEPYGISLIFGAWNYPFQLALDPLIGAISAGNCAIVKVSSQSTYTSHVIEEMINQKFDPAYIHVVQGDHDFNVFLLSQPFDHIFFTGSPRVGKMVMHAAAELLIPVVLELGGKSPTIVCADVDIDVAARRIVWGKFLNAGQTCIAPDYMYVHESIKDRLVGAMKKWIGIHYYLPPQAGETDPQFNLKGFPKIINLHHYQRLMAHLKEGNILTGGVGYNDEHIITPTLMDGITWEDPIMCEEIFGPILPIFTFSSLDQVIGQINTHFSKPLACYIFTNSKSTQQKIIDSISFGGGTINDTLTHIANPNLPYGGVGASGIGKYHGKASFDAFSNHKALLRKGWHPDLAIRYPPYTTSNLKLLKKLLK